MAEAAKASPGRDERKRPVFLPSRPGLDTSFAPPSVETLGYSRKVPDGTAIESLHPPKEAFVQVRFRDHWFYIEDRDLRSKRTMNFLALLFSLGQDQQPGTTPVLTILTS